MHAPHKAPRRMRGINPERSVLFGAEGSWSAINSPMARSVKTVMAAILPIKRNDVLARSIQLRCAAQATTAGAVRARSPQTKPIVKAEIKIPMNDIDLHLCLYGNRAAITLRSSNQPRFNMNARNERSMHRTFVGNLQKFGALLPG